MYTIRTYTNTRCELEMAKTRLNLLMDKNQELWSKFFPVTAQPKEIVVDGGLHNNDKMASYMEELLRVDIGTGMSLAQEIEEQQKKIYKLQGYLDDMESTLSKLKGIEYSLYYEIVVNGLNVSKAVDKVARDFDKDSQTIWKNHYRKIKKYIKTIFKYTQ